VVLIGVIEADGQQRQHLAGARRQTQSRRFRYVSHARSPFDIARAG
jgi:hypothetical protein